MRITSAHVMSRTSWMGTSRSGVTVPTWNGGVLPASTNGFSAQFNASTICWPVLSLPGEMSGLIGPGGTGIEWSMFGGTSNRNEWLKVFWTNVAVEGSPGVA